LDELVNQVNQELVAEVRLDVMVHHQVRLDVLDLIPAAMQWDVQDDPVMQSRLDVMDIPDSEWDVMVYPAIRLDVQDDLPHQSPRSVDCCLHVVVESDLDILVDRDLDTPVVQAIPDLDTLNPIAMFLSMLLVVVASYLLLYLM
jgi:hypothetical protein